MPPRTRHNPSGDSMKHVYGGRALAAALLAAGLVTLSAPARAQIAVSANDGKVRLENGVAKVIAGGADSVAIIDLSPALRGQAPKLIAEIAAPASIVGPPQSV